MPRQRARLQVAANKTQFLPVSENTRKGQGYPGPFYA